MEGSGWPPAPQLHRLFAFGRERTIEQDPAFALRILVDVAIKALSLRTRYALRGCDEKTRLVIPGRSWEDYLQLAVTEIREYGATSTQVCRRLRALLEALLRAAPAECRPAVGDRRGP